MQEVLKAKSQNYSQQFLNSSFATLKNMSKKVTAFIDDEEKNPSQHLFHVSWNIQNPHEHLNKNATSGLSTCNVFVKHTQHRNIYIYFATSI
jgi:hypothetical protein